MSANAASLDWTKPVRMTEAEYLEFEESARLRHEFYDGVVRPLGLLIGMAGGTYEHGLVIANVLRSAGNRLDGTGLPRSQQRRAGQGRAHRPLQLSGHDDHL